MAEQAEALAPMVDEKLADFAASIMPAIQEPLFAIEEHVRTLIAEAQHRFAPQQSRILVPQPDPGQPVVYVPAGVELFYPVSVIARLTTSAVAGNRTIVVEYQDGNGDRDVVAGGPVTLAASQSQTFNWWHDAGRRTWPADDTAIAPLPKQYLLPRTDRLVIRVGNMDAADQLDRVRIVAERFRAE